MRLLIAFLVIAVHGMGDCRGCSPFSEANAAVVLNVGVGRDIIIGEQFERTAKVGYAIPVFEGFSVRPEVAGWMTGRTGHKSGVLFALPLEFRAVSPGGIYASISFGPGVITSPDAWLGGHFQFDTELALGVMAGNGLGCGLAYGHVSSAGIYEVNKGRDWLMIQLVLFN
jgi:hypothetical protein